LVQGGLNIGTFPEPHYQNSERITRCQFHQHFFAHVFCTKDFFLLTFWLCMNFRKKSTCIKRWWNWHQESISSTFFSILPSDPIPICVGLKAFDHNHYTHPLKSFGDTVLYTPIKCHESFEWPLTKITFFKCSSNNTKRKCVYPWMTSQIR